METLSPNKRKLTASARFSEVCNSILASLRYLWNLQSKEVANSSQLFLKLTRRPGRPIGTTKRAIGAGADPSRIEAIRVAVDHLNTARVLAKTKSFKWPKVTDVQKISGLTDISHWELRIACPYFYDCAPITKFDPPDLTFGDGSWYIKYTNRGVDHCYNLFTKDVKKARRLRDFYDCTGEVDLSDPLSWKV